MTSTDAVHNTQINHLPMEKSVRLHIFLIFLTLSACSSDFGLHGSATGSSTSTAQPAGFPQEPQVQPTPALIETSNNQDDDQTGAGSEEDQNNQTDSTVTPDADGDGDTIQEAIATLPTEVSGMYLTCFQVGNLGALPADLKQSEGDEIDEGRGYGCGIYRRPIEKVTEPIEVLSVDVICKGAGFIKNVPFSMGENDANIADFYFRLEKDQCKPDRIQTSTKIDGQPIAIGFPLWENSTYTCSDGSPVTQLYILGLYEPARDNGRGGPAEYLVDNNACTGIVTSAYEAVNWNIEVAPGSEVAYAIFTAWNTAQQRSTGLDPSMVEIIPAGPSSPNISATPLSFESSGTIDLMRYAQQRFGSLIPTVLPDYWGPATRVTLPGQ